MLAPLLAAQQKLYYRLRPLRDRLVRPLVLFFAALQLTPNTISLLGVLTMVAFVVVAAYALSLALALLLLSLLLDATDGGLARYLKVDSDKGKLIDVTADATAFTLFLAGLVVGELITLRLGLLLAAIMVLSKLLRIKRHGHLLPTDWRFRPVAGFIPTGSAYVLYTAFAVAALTSRNYLPAIATALTVVLALDMLITLFLLGHKKSLLTI